MESYEEILTCKVCMERMNDNDRKPLFLQCGHTFCGKCLRLIYHKPNIKCPMDKSHHKYDTFEKIPINFSVLNVIDTQKQESNGNLDLTTRYYKKCEQHPKQDLKFYCENDKKLICQDCLLQDHLGPNHSIQSSDNYLQDEIFLSDLQRCAEKVKAYEKQIQEQQQKQLQDLKNQKQSLVETTKQLVGEIQEQLKSCIEEFDQVIQDSDHGFEVELEKLQKYEESIEQMQKQIQSKDNGNKLAIENLRTLIQSIAHYQVEDKSDQMEIDDCIYVSGDLSKHLFVQKSLNPDPTLKALLQGFKTRDVINQQVYELMIKVDRKNFVPDEIASSSYSDLPRSIGWGTTISAPHMHAMTLQRLCEKAPQGGRALDIGVGSGYMAAALAEHMGRDCKVYALEHIREIIDFANTNIKKGNPYLLKQKRIQMVLMDGRRGFAEHGPYDVIHVGGAIPEVSELFLDQLKPGGRMWVPVGGGFSQQIQVIDKDLNGNVTTEKIMDVRYGSLTSVEEQMSDF